MRSLLLVLALAGCDPIWHVRNAATMQTARDAPCIDAGLRATKLEVRPADIPGPKRIWYVGDRTREAMQVEWAPEHPDRIELSLAGMGTTPPPWAAEEYRRLRDVTLREVERTCGRIELGPETCTRMTCGPAK
jgi:hypothetical protein